MTEDKAELVFALEAEEFSEYVGEGWEVSVSFHCV